MGNPQKSKGQNGTSIADIAEKIGETERTAETEVINISKLGQNVQVSKTTADRIRKDNATIKGQNAFENNNSGNRKSRLQAHGMMTEDDSLKQ